MIPIETTNLQLGEAGRERHSVGMWIGDIPSYPRSGIIHEWCHGPCFHPFVWTCWEQPDSTGVRSKKHEHVFLILRQTQVKCHLMPSWNWNLIFHGLIMVCPILYLYSFVFYYMPLMSHDTTLHPIERLIFPTSWIHLAAIKCGNTSTQLQPPFKPCISCIFFTH